MPTLRGTYYLMILALAALSCCADQLPVAHTAEPRAAKHSQATGACNGDWPQLGGTSARNNVASKAPLRTTWSVPKFNAEGRPIAGSGSNIKWVVDLGANSMPAGLASGPVVAGGKVFVGSNNRVGYVPRLPKNQELNCLLCFREEDGKFLWQFASEPISKAKGQRCALNALVSAPYVEADRVWIVTNRDEIVCLDIEGFADDENDGPFRDEPNEHPDEADIIWKLDLRERFGVSPHNLAHSSITAAGDVLFVGTSNGLDEGHINVPNPQAPSLLALDKNTGRVVWSAGLGEHILHGQWSSPAVAELSGRSQLLYGGGDGWLYSFATTANRDGQSQQFWRFDCNAGRVRAPNGDRPISRYIVNSPVVYQDWVYAAIGEDAEHGEGPGCLWCIDPSRQGDISGEVAKGPNANTGVVWKYEQFDANRDGRITFDETMHLANGSPAIQDDLLVIADNSGLVHCVNIRTGRPHWTHDLLAACYSTPLIAGGYVYVGDEDGDMTIFKLSARKEVVAEINMPSSIVGAPITAGGVLYVLTKKQLWAIKEPTP